MVKVHSIQARKRRALCHTGGTPGHRRVLHHLLVLGAAWRYLHARARGLANVEGRSANPPGKSPLAPGAPVVR